MKNPQLSRKEELQKEIEIEQKNVKFQEGINAVIDFTDIQLSILNKRELQARLDERIRAEQDFLKNVEKLKKRIMINGNLSNRIVEVDKDSFIRAHDMVLNCIVCEIIDEELKSTIQKETKE